MADGERKVRCRGSDEIMSCLPRPLSPLTVPSDGARGGPRNELACAYAEMRKSEATSIMRQSPMRQGFVWLPFKFLERRRFTWKWVGGN